MKKPPRPCQLTKKRISTLKTPAFVCARCGECCKEEGALYFTPREVTRAAEYLNIPRKNFIKAFLVKVEKGYAHMVKKGESCIFLKNNQCRINDVKPSQCATFPYWEIYFNAAGNLVNFDRKCRGFDNAEKKRSR